MTSICGVKTALTKDGSRRMEFSRHKDFDRSVVMLSQRGGPYLKAANRIDTVLGKVARGNDDPLAGLKPTKNGETRIRKCVKYDLGTGIRLITLQDNGVVLLCFAGTHDDSDAWLDRKRGATLARSRNGQMELVQIGLVGDGDEIHVPVRNLSRGPLYEQLDPVEAFDSLVEGLPRSLVRAFEALEAGVSQSEIQQLGEEVSDPEQAEAIVDVLTLLNEDEPERALQRIRIYTGASQRIEELSPEEIARLAESDEIRRIPIGDPNYPRILAHFARHGAYMDWMLYLHPEQQDIVDRGFSGSAKLVGVSGAGKTCVIVQRAIRLARAASDEKVLVLTLNRQLARLIRDMKDAATLPEISDRIEVLPLFELCQRLLKQFEPQNERLYDDVTWKANEHIDEIWREFYRCELNNDDARVLIPVHDSLISRGVDAEQYIREEFDWIRSAFKPEERQSYLDAERAGRGFPLDKRYRALLLEALDAWERKMRMVGVTDYLGLSTVLTNYLGQIQPLYRHVLVDESQDLGTIELALIRRLVAEGEDDIFLCGDAAQRVQAKHGSLSQAGIDIPGARSLKLQKNYRNSREILAAAHKVLKSNLTEDMPISPDFESLNPEHANFTGAPPLLLRADSLEDEIEFALAYVDQYLEDTTEKKCCIAFCGYSLYQIQKFGEWVKMPVLDGETNITKENAFLADLEHTKGFEFDVVIILNCAARVMPDALKPVGEQFRDLSRFYVAMTRAKYELILSYADEPSSYIKSLWQGDYALDEHWANYTPDVIPEDGSTGLPPSLTEIREAHQQIDPLKAALDLSGPEFLYTSYAIGQSGSLIEKLRTLVSKDATRVVRGRRIPIGWKTLRSAARDVAEHPQSRQQFGPETINEFRKLIRRLEDDQL